ncbi:Uncharacterised protein [Mycobacteroides abscessus subsp. abscessus]|nr:Uncharacterised protein [Mycobacteroides abscessus subsp. abscessus]
MSHQYSFIDRSCVVIQTASDRKICNNIAGSSFRCLTYNLFKLAESFFKQRVFNAQLFYFIDKTGVFSTNLSQIQRRLRLLVAGAQFVFQQLCNGVGTNFFELINGTQNAGGIVQSNSTIKTFGEFAVINTKLEISDFKLSQGFNDNQCQFDVVAEGQSAVPHNIYICLGEFAETTILRAFSTPDFLHLITHKGKVQISRIFDDIAGKRYGEIKVEGQLLLL